MAMFEACPECGGKRFIGKVCPHCGAKAAVPKKKPSKKKAKP